MCGRRSMAHRRSNAHTYAEVQIHIARQGRKECKCNKKKKNRKNKRMYVHNMASAWYIALEARRRGLKG